MELGRLRPDPRELSRMMLEEDMQKTLQASRDQKEHDGDKRDS
jgi:hypothetical protein